MPYQTGSICAYYDITDFALANISCVLCLCSAQKRATNSRPQ